MGSARRSDAARLLRILFALLFMASIVWAGVLLWRQWRAGQAQRELLGLHESAVRAAELAGGDAAAYVDPLSEINPDYFGWLKVYGTMVDYPVVLGADNEYYLKHDFYGDYDANGCLFADAAVDPEADGNILIYGHHMRSGAMFGSLRSFSDADFFAEHGTVRWDFRGQERYYDIFAVLVIPGYERASDYFPIQDYVNELTTEEARGLIDAIAARPGLHKDITIDETDRFMFLVTCDYTRTNGRLLLCARQIG